ncbi:hypothetical protein RvY_16842 [Ramazzottius varieornatus]|uniref:Reverse transcriptase domain-containing protein n=1 Tax=Ramazzottius varieornatus TaxID=947166 RepID=A0A1D1W669_RAMVA|nr:hypothetical protein RvY_16842 [Ramazzottius varieornatus]
MVVGSAGKARKEKRDSTNATLKKIVEGELNDADISGALRVLSSEDIVAVPSLEILRSKHPAEAAGSSFPEPPDPTQLPDDVTVDEIMAAVQSLPNGSAGGIDCLRPKHMKDMLAGAANGTTTALAESLPRLVTLIVQGKVPTSVTSIFFEASLTAPKKKDGGIRPIAVGNTLRRLPAKIVSKRVGKEVDKRATPRQVGCGTTTLLVVSLRM